MSPMPTDDPPLYWLEGHLHRGATLTLPLDDPGWLYGATVFTTLRVYEQHLSHPWTAWAAHVERTRRSLQTLHWPQPDWHRVEQGAIRLATEYPVLRVTIFPDGRELITGRSLPPNLASSQTTGVFAWVADSPDYSRPLPGHKTGNYLGCWLALQAAKRHQAQEAILVNAADHWLETSTGNLWGWAQGAWWTPPLATGILPGVMRSRLLQGLAATGAIVHTDPWTPSLISQFTTLSYTNSVVEVLPLRGILRGATCVNYNPDQEAIASLKAAWQFIR